MNPETEAIARLAPCYVYDEAEIVRRCTLLKTAAPAFRWLYSVKCNPHAKVLQTVRREGFGLDAASAAEVDRGLAAGFAGEEISYSAPGKTDRAIRSALGKCRLIVDSVGELERVVRTAFDMGIAVADVGVRIHPDFGFDGGAPLPTPFGMSMADAEEAAVLARDSGRVRITGAHIHLRSQCLEAAVIGRYWENCAESAERLQEKLAGKLDYFNFGSGPGIAYNPAEQTELDLDALAVFARRAAGEPVFSGVALFAETGRFVAAAAGVYYTPVVDVKVSQGVKYLIVQNALNGFSRAVFANLQPGLADGQEPLFTTHGAHPVTIENACSELERVTVVGNLCTAADVVARNALLPKARPGDLMCIANAGAYARSLSPLAFSSHEPPRELWRDAEGRITEEPPE